MDRCPMRLIVLIIGGFYGTVEVSASELHRFHCVPCVCSYHGRSISTTRSLPNNPAPPLLQLSPLEGARGLSILLDESSPLVTFAALAARNLRGGNVEGDGSSLENEREPGDNDLDPARNVQGATGTSNATTRGVSPASGPTARVPSSTKTPVAQGESKVDAIEEGLRFALMHAQGLNRILREVERIPALRRLSDSALRVTSATDADGRLAALALYRLGAAARASEKASAHSPASASTSAPSVASSVEHSRDEPSTGDGGTADDGDQPQDTSGTGHAGGTSDSTSEAAVIPLAATPGTLDPDVGGQLGPVDEPTAPLGADCSPPSGSPAQDGSSSSIEDVLLAPHARQGVGWGDAVQQQQQQQQQQQEVTGEVRAQDQTQIHAQDQAQGVTTFDPESVTSDQRFEQLVEIIECTASRLSVSDMSKVVWGLSILGHVPGNSLLESLAGFLTNRLREELIHFTAPQPGAALPAGYGELDAASDATQPERVSSDSLRERAASKAASSVKSFVSENKGEGEKGDASQPGDEAGAAQRGELGSGGGGHLPSMTSPSPPFYSSSSSSSSSSLSPESLGGPHKNEGAPVAGEKSATDAVDEATVSARVTASQAKPSSVDGEADQPAGQALSVSAVTARPRTSGTDLATAALSFAYAHARLGIFAGDLLEVIAESVKPQLRSMVIRDLANLAWGFAAQEQLDEEMMGSIAHQVLSDRAEGGMTAKDSSLFAWSFGMLGLRPSKVMRKLTREALSTIDEASTQDISNLAWGLARAGSSGRELKFVDPAKFEAREQRVPVEDDRGAQTLELGGSVSTVHGDHVASPEGDSSRSQGGEDTDGSEEAMKRHSSASGDRHCSSPSEYRGTDGDGDEDHIKKESSSDSSDGGAGRAATRWGWIRSRARRHKGEKATARQQGYPAEEVRETADADADANADVDRDQHGVDSAKQETLRARERKDSRNGDAKEEYGRGAARIPDNSDGNDEGPEREWGEDGGDVQDVLPELVDEKLDEASPETRLGEALLVRAREKFRAFQPKQLARLSWALGAWHEQGIDLPGAGGFAARVLTEAGQHPRDYSPEELAQVLWSFAMLVGNADSPGQELAGLVGILTAGFEWGEGHTGSDVGGLIRVGGGGLDANTACDVLWSLATIGYPAHALCEAMGRALVDHVPELPPSAVARLVWAHAKMGHPSAELMERVLSVVERRLDDFAIEDAAGALWALGALGYTVSLKRQFHLRMEDLRSLNPSSMANLLWGLVKTEAAFAEGFDKECLEAVAAGMGPRLLSFSPRELCRTAWALGRLAGGHDGVGSYASAFDGGGGDAEGTAEEDGAASSEEISKPGGELRGLLEKLLGECSKWLELFTPQELETLLWAICKAEHRADAFVSAMTVEATARQEGLATLLQNSGPAAARDAAFHLGAFRHLLTLYRDIDFDGHRSRGRYQRGKSMLSRMFRER